MRGQGSAMARLTRPSLATTSMERMGRSKSRRGYMTQWNTCRRARRCGGGAGRRELPGGGGVAGKVGRGAGLRRGGQRLALQAAAERLVRGSIRRWIGTFPAPGPQLRRQCGSSTRACWAATAAWQVWGTRYCLADRSAEAPHLQPILAGRHLDVQLAEGTGLVGAVLHLRRIQGTQAWRHGGAAVP